MSPYSIVEPTDYSRSSANSTSSIECQSKINSPPGKFNWNEIFYLNQNDDFKRYTIEKK